MVGTLHIFVRNSCVMKQHFIHNCYEMVKVEVRQSDEINLWLKLITCVYFFEKPVNNKKKKRFCQVCGEAGGIEVSKSFSKLLNPVANFTQAGKKG